MTLISTKTQHPRTTVTPTSTITVDRIQIDTTTLAQKTDTITSTVLTTTTSTLVVDISQTNTVDTTTIITEVPTVTASTASNFTPFASEPAVIAAGGGTSPNKRHEAPRLPRRGLHDLAARSKKKNLSGTLYPQSVACIVFVDNIVTQVTTVTDSNTKIYTAPAVIATSTSIETITSTVVPGDASTTLTTTSTATSLTVSLSLGVTTVTSTTTSTVFAGATVTYYPQCQSNNLVEYVGGQPLYYLQSNSFTMVSTPDAVTCCQTCANRADCAGFAGPSSGFTDCYIFGDLGTCNAATSDWTTYIANGQTSDFDVVGNGNCGQGTFGGSL